MTTGNRLEMAHLRCSNKTPEFKDAIKRVSKRQHDLAEILEDNGVADKAEATDHKDSDDTLPSPVSAKKAKKSAGAAAGGRQSPSLQSITGSFTVFSSLN